jgi:cysteine desulfurase
LSTFSDSLSHSFVGEGGERVTVFRTNDYSRCDVRHLSPRGKDAGTEAGATGKSGREDRVTKIQSMPIYLDHNAGSPIRSEVRGAIAALLDAGAANPSSVHRSGQTARRFLERARGQVAALIGAAPAQIVFCSGGTEANNFAIEGSVRSRIAPDREGRLNPAAIMALLDKTTALVTLGLANSEVGTIQDFSSLAAPIRSAGALFHIDAAQAVGRIAVDASQLGCDLMTVSGHKLGAPAGIGALFVRDPSAIAALIRGGPQERSLRAGTPNLIGAVGFGAAAAIARERLAEESARMTTLRDLLLSRLTAAIPGLALNSPRDGVLPNTLNLRFPGVLGETMLIALDLEGVQVSMGSACAAGAVEPSHVLIAMGHGVSAARSSLRISLGYSTTSWEVEEACAIIAALWRRIAQRATQEAAVPAL